MYNVQNRKKMQVITGNLINASHTKIYRTKHMFKKVTKNMI